MVAKVPFLVVQHRLRKRLQEEDVHDGHDQRIASQLYLPTNCLFLNYPKNLSEYYPYISQLHLIIPNHHI